MMASRGARARETREKARIAETARGDSIINLEGGLSSINEVFRYRGKYSGRLKRKGRSGSDSRLVMHTTN